MRNLREAFGERVARSLPNLREILRE